MRIRLIFPGALGDFLLLAPAAMALARRGHAIELSVGRALTEIAGLSFALGPPADGAAIMTLFTPTLDALVARWLKGADVVHAWLGAAGATAASHVSALAIGAWQDHAVVRDDGARHASAEYAAALGIETSLTGVRLPLAADDAAHRWRCAEPGRLVVHPGAGTAAKRWPQAAFREVADAWRARGREAVVLLGPAEAELAPLWRASEHPVVTDLTLGAAARLIASARRYVGNDSGMSHLAGALERRGVVLFGPTRPERWRPLGGALTALCFSPAAADVAAPASTAEVLAALDQD